jgi:hypothetical protein
MRPQAVNDIAQILLLGIFLVPLLTHAVLRLAA